MSISADTNKSLIELVFEKLMLTDVDYAIGIFEDSGTYEDGKTVVQVGYDNEYGVPANNVPPRPFLVPGGQKGFKKAAEQAILAIANGYGEEIALARAAQVMKQSIQRYITALQTPPNAPLTVMLKGSSNPLIDTGKMRRSINYKREK